VSSKCEQSFDELLTERMPDAFLTAEQVTGKTPEKDCLRALIDHVKRHCIPGPAPPAYVIFRFHNILENCNGVLSGTFLHTNRKKDTAVAYLVKLASIATDDGDPSTSWNLQQPISSHEGEFCCMRVPSGCQIWKWKMDVSGSITDGSWRYDHYDSSGEKELTLSGNKTTILTFLFEIDDDDLRLGFNAPKGDWTREIHLVFMPQYNMRWKLAVKEVGALSLQDMCVCALKRWMKKGHNLGIIPSHLTGLFSGE